MNLLPKHISNFSKEEYWNTFFSKRGTSAFEWYGEYPQLCRLLHKYIRPLDKLLVIGCGNSRLSADLYDAGFHNNISIDISNVVIKQMNDKYVKKRPGLEFLKMNMLQMSFEDERFSVILDKGTLDALMSEGTDDYDKKADMMFSEIKRTLKFCGRYICISLLQDYILKKLLTWFTNEGWMVRIHRCTEIEDLENSHSKRVFPVFIIICTKMKTSQGMKLSTELDMTGALVRVDCFDDVFSSVKSVQEYNMYRHYIQNKRFLENDVVLELSQDGNEHPRYTLHIIDQAKSSPNKYAVFIVPQGRETEWLFASLEGRKQLIDTAGCERLVVVHLNRHHSYASLDEIKSELSSKVMEFSPLNYTATSQVPFLSIDADIGKRTIRCSSKSNTVGDYIVEDVEGNEGEVVRRLIFFTNQNSIQSEARLKRVTVRKNKKGKQIRLEIDHNHLSCQHHSYMIAGLAFLPEDKREMANILVIGLGGGGLPMFLRHRWNKASIEVVELDPEIAKIATQWFGLNVDEKLKLHIADGIEFIAKCVQEDVKFDAVMVDVDNKDVASGLSSPPVSFIEVPFLQQLFQVLHNDGVLILNFACRNLHLKEKVYSNIITTFGDVFLDRVPEEVNEIIFALPRVVKKENSLPLNIEDSLCKLMRKLEISVRNSLFNAKDFIEGLKIIK